MLGRFWSLARLQRTVFVDRARPHSGLHAMRNAERLKAGDMLVLFAEGRIGRWHAVLPFKSLLPPRKIQAWRFSPWCVIQATATPMPRRPPHMLGMATWNATTSLGSHGYGPVKLNHLPHPLPDRSWKPGILAKKKSGRGGRRGLVEPLHGRAKMSWHTA
jgi:hypothetical protein